MKKLLLLIFALVPVVLMLSGCVPVVLAGYYLMPDDAKYENGDIIYNDSTYSYANYKINNFYSPATESFNPRNYKDEKTMLGGSTSLKAIYSAWEKDFGDNVLQDFDVDGWHGYYFKEGFELPEYKSLTIDEVFVKGISVYKSPSDKQLFINDIIDYGTAIQTDAVEKSSGDFLCTLKEYDCIVIGSYDIAIINGDIYLKLPDYEVSTYGRVNNDYQNLIKESLKIQP